VGKYKIEAPVGGLGGEKREVRSSASRRIETGTQPRGHIEEGKGYSSKRKIAGLRELIKTLRGAF